MEQYEDEYRLQGLTFTQSNGEERDTVGDDLAHYQMTTHQQQQRSANTLRSKILLYQKP